MLMIERLARVLANDQRRVTNVSGDDWLAMPKSQRKAYADRVRLMLRELRDIDGPTVEVMADAFVSTNDLLGELMQKSWNAAIDHILESGP